MKQHKKEGHSQKAEETRAAIFASFDALEACRTDRRSEELFTDGIYLYKPVEQEENQSAFC